MKSIALVVGLMLLLIAVPLQAQSLTDAQKAEIEKAVKGQVVELCRTFDTVDTEAYMKLWSRDKLIGEVSSGQLDTSIDSIMNRSKTANAATIRRKNDIQETKIHLFSPDVAFVTCKTLGKRESKNGDVTNFNWLGTMIWVRESGGWKLAFMAQSSATIQ